VTILFQHLGIDMNNFIDNSFGCPLRNADSPIR
jgi:hypothetical protein